mmetsp:Transcript_27312/g.43939  ORF Transcript_27312/g.43939 Transcript_27312/m.43939 type:complete len:602 (-) Transcript_27312:2425-4230(-)
MIGGEVVSCGWLTRYCVEYRIEGEDEDLFDKKQGMNEFFVLVRFYQNGKPVFSGRFFSEEPPVEFSQDGSIAQLVGTLKKFDTNCKLNSIVDFTLSTVIVSSGQNVWISTTERTMMLTPMVILNKDKLDDILENLRAAQVELSGSGAGNNRSLTSRISKRFSKKPRRAIKSQKSSTIPSQLKRELRSLGDILDNKPYRHEFRQYLKFAFASENLDFYEAVERFEAVPQGDARDRSQMYVSLMNQFVKEGSEFQVNLPSHQARMLCDIQAQLAAEEEGAEIEPGVFAESKHEIYCLMDRNFYHGFVLRVQEKEKREKQIQTMAGSLVKVWRQQGLAGYNRLMEYFKEQLANVSKLSDFLRELLTFYEVQLGALQDLSSRFPAMRKLGGSLPPEKSIDRALHQLYTGVSRKISVLMEFSRDINACGVIPVAELRVTMETSMANIHEMHQPLVDEMINLRKDLNNLIKCENDAFRLQKELKQQQAETKKKLSKKQQSALTQAVADFENARKARENAEFAVVEGDTKHSDTMLAACDMLESIELHRLDTEREVLTQIALAEKSMCAKTEIGVQSFLFDGMEVDPIGQIMNLALELQKPPRRITLS